MFVNKKKVIIVLIILKFLEGDVEGIVYLVIVIFYMYNIEDEN